MVPGWETAVETALGVYLEAICIDDINSVISTVKTLTHGNLVLFDTTAQPLAEATIYATTLTSKVNLRAELLAKVSADQSGMLDIMLKQWWSPSTRTILKTIIDSLQRK